MTDQQYNPKIPKDQWELPIGFLSNGDPVTLINFKKHREFIMLDEYSTDAYNQEAVRRLVLNRLNKVKNYGSFSFNNEHINKDKAIREVEKGSELGDYIIAIEMETIKALIEVLDKNN